MRPRPSPLATAAAVVAAILTIAGVVYATNNPNPREDLDQDLTPARSWFKTPDGGRAGQRGTPTGAGHVHEEGASVAQGGSVALEAGIFTDGGYLEATRVPAADAGLTDRTGLSIQNLGSSPIWCGFSSSTSDLTGTQVDGSPDGVHAGGAFQAEVGAGVPVYCWSRAGQTSPADTRWTEVR